MQNKDFKHYHQKERATRLRNLVHVVVRDLAGDQCDKGYGHYDTLRVSTLADAIAGLLGDLGDEVGEDLWAGLMHTSGLNKSEGPLNPSAETRGLVVAGLLEDLNNLKGKN